MDNNDTKHDDYIADIAIPPKSKYAPKGIDHNLTLELKAKGLSSYQIAKIVGGSASNIRQVLASYGVSQRSMARYKEHRADILAGLQDKVLRYHLSDDKIQKLPPTIAPLWYNTLINNERLDRGQATSIQEIRELSVDFSEICKLVRAKSDGG